MRNFLLGNDHSGVTIACIGSPLASLIYAAAELFEKGIQFQDSHNNEETIIFPRNYYFANILYEYLLLSPYLEHRRGRWYKRLAINYDHLKLSELVVLSLLRGLQDPNTQVGCRININRINYALFSDCFGGFCSYLKKLIYVID